MVVAKPLPKTKEKGEPWKKGIFAGMNMVSNMNLVSTRSGIVKSRTMRQCSPTFDVETLANACGTPWNYNQEQLTGRSKQPKRLPPSSGIEVAPIEGPPVQVPRTPAVVVETPQYIPTESERPSDAMASDPPTSDHDDDDEDPGEGQRGSEASSRKGATARKRDEASLTSGEAGEGDPEGPSKRELEGGATEEPEATRPRVDEGSGQVEERPEKIQRGEPSGTVRRVTKNYKNLFSL